VRRLQGKGTEAEFH